MTGDNPWAKKKTSGGGSDKPKKTAKSLASLRTSASSSSGSGTTQKPTNPYTSKSRTQSNSPSSSPPRSLSKRQPFGGSRDGSWAAHIKRARALQRSFAPGMRVRITWKFDPAFGQGHGEFVGDIDHYDERGWLYAISPDQVRFEAPSGMLTVTKA
jgi:hypothetical protein